MSLHIALHHETRYRYDRAVSLGAQTIRLRPAPHCRTPILSYSLRVSPEPHFLNWLQDPQGNFLARVVFPQPTEHFDVTVDLTADMSIINPFDFFVEESADRYPFKYEPHLREELRPFLSVERASPKLAAWVSRMRVEDEQIVDYLVRLNQTLQREIDYVVRLEPGVQTPEQTLTLARGSCRDSAWLAVQILRHLGIAARFASGYLVQLTADVASLDGPSGPSHDFTDLHAWAEAYVPGAGWIGLDPTSGLLAGEGHIPLACSPHPQSAAPIAGSLDECEVTFEHEMAVTRIVETARVTKPYTEPTWQAIEELGQKVDRRLAEGDVRLTMGGEPTFVSVDDMDGAEWNTEAMGPTKRARADDLVRRLRARFAPGGVLQYGQGKWYPGEPLPRWSFQLIWRTDGVPLWRDDRLIARELDHLAPEDTHARQLATAIAARLELEPDVVAPLFEDPLVALKDESALPTNVDWRAGDLDREDARARLTRTLSRGLSKPTAFVLPVQRWNARDKRPRWISERWQTRRGALFLAPGDSPAGLRLPLGSLPKFDEVEFPGVIVGDPTWEQEPLPPTPPRLQATGAPGKASSARARESRRVAGPDPGMPPVRTALVVEPRGGRLCVFLPPVASADEYIELVAIVEETARALGTPIHLEGYPPPHDSRLQRISVTPDPGVIEVNIHPVASWKELVANTEGLYADAHAARLATEKFMLDGRHTGTGGGNHIVLGAAHPSDSPFLRRPDLLKSLLGYWLSHPSLSYLFSGLFIGPTSQAPRVDEARHDSIHELEIAFAQVPERGFGAIPPWLVDRLFRDLLADVTGNTHRTEICIDKLYSPDSTSGRLGLVELRSFEMPPHARMSLVQQLLLRALVARFWETPWRGRLPRFGSTLHDRFMLPHFVWADFGEVIDELRDAGFPLERSWFEPHYEFRFPRYGKTRYRDIEIEVRQALEPWHVLAEDGAVGGTARYVDSSLERLQVRVEGIDLARYAIACNGVRVPLHEAGARQSYVGGVRYRAWQPPRCLHPTVPVDSPLTIDLYDRQHGRAVAGCRYHVSHPGGRAAEDFPVNGHAAEGRRLARFAAFGHTPGSYALHEPEIDRDFPTTLDLRRSARPSR